MSNAIEINRVNGGFIIVTYGDTPSHTNRTVACCTDTLLSIVGAWGDGTARVLPPVAPDAAPAPFRVGDRVVFVKERTAAAYGNGPHSVHYVFRNGCEIQFSGSGKIVTMQFDFDELRHAPEEV